MRKRVLQQEPVAKFVPRKRSAREPRSELGCSKQKAFAALFLMTISLPSVAWGMPEFPSHIQEHLGLSTPPGCIICHDSNAGGGVVSQPFGRAMVAAGLTSLGGDSLSNALAKLEVEKTDSNRDGVLDIDGLRKGILPTTGKPPVEYGCGGARVAANRAPFDWHAPAVSLLLLSVLTGRIALRSRYTKTRKTSPLRADGTDSRATR